MNKMTHKKIDEAAINRLYDVLISLKTREDCEALLGDLCTINETEQMAGRIMAAELLLEGKTYNQVIEQTDISSATLSRVSRCVKYGEGYARFLKK